MKETPMEDVDVKGNSSSNASPSAMASPTTEDAEPSAADDGAGYDPGSVLWHCSEEEGGPDVGIQVGLGFGLSLYFGEMPTETLLDCGIDLATYPDGWWIVLYGPEDTKIIGAVPDHHVAQEGADLIAWAVEKAEEAVPAAWRPIESAPRDGSRILGWIVYSGDLDWNPEPFKRVSIMDWDEGCANPGWERPPGWHKEWIGEPTHWMPLPSPPVEAAGSAIGKSHRLEAIPSSRTDSGSSQASPAKSDRAEGH